MARRIVGNINNVHALFTAILDSSCMKARMPMIKFLGAVSASVQKKVMYVSKPKHRNYCARRQFKDPL